MSLLQEIGHHLKQYFSNPWDTVKTAVIVVVLLGLALFALSKDAESHENSIAFIPELGTTLASGEPSSGMAALISFENQDGWALQTLWVNQQTAKMSEGRVQIDPYMGVGFQKSATIWSGLKAGVGVMYLNETNRLHGSQLVFNLRAGYDLTPRLSINWRHLSNAGTGSPNAGQDMITFAYRYGK